jgi:pimeloyl-ACP methyl ester carboxylesterase
MMSRLVLLLGCVLTVSSSYADWKEFYFQKRMERTHSTPRLKLRASQFAQKLDPQNSADPREFFQRYYVDKTYGSGKDAPVLFFLCGEATCQSFSLQGAIRSHAKKLKANMVALEHRYYGESQPFDTLTPENLKYLTTDNALADAARFQKYAQSELGLEGKWIVLGGSYPGSLAAYYREKYSQLVVGALASSGPVQAKANFETYDLYVATVAGPECGALMKQVNTEVEASLKDPDQAKAMKKKFEAEALTNNDDFLYLIADMGALAIQYGYRDHFCDLLKEGEPLEGYATFVKEIYQSWDLNAVSGSVQGALSLDWHDYLSGVGLRQWYYQSCTEFGYWQNAYHDSSKSVRSARINPEYHQNVCRRLFNLDQPVDTSHINKTFYEPLLTSASSRILFTNGSQDPWSQLSIAKANGNDLNPLLTLYLIDQAAHCADLHAPLNSDSSSLKQSRTLFETLAAEWLKES